MTSQPLDIPDMGPTIGPQLVGVIVGAWMFGLFTLQVYNYYQNFPSDSKRLKYSVFFLFILEITHVTMSCVGLYSLVVTNFGNAEIVKYIHKAVASTLLISAFVGPSVQAFYATRILRLSNQSPKYKYPIPVLCYTLSLVRSASLFASFVAALQTPFIPAFVKKWDWLILGSIGVSTFNDILIAVMLCWLLWERRSDGVKSTQQRIDSLIMFTINTGSVTCIASFLMLIFFVGVKNDAWMTMLFIIPRLFANSLLASLNSRAAYRNASSVHTHQSIHTHQSMGGGVGKGQRYPTNPISIEMSRSHITDSDLPDMMVLSPTKSFNDDRRAGAI